MDNLSLLTSPLPESIELSSGLVLSIDVRACVALDVLDRLEDERYTQRQRAAYAISRIVKNPFPAESVEEVIELVGEFLRCNDPDLPSQKSTGKPTFSYWQDARHLVAAFQQAYGIDLTKDDLHWWRFRALLEGLPDSTRLAQIMQIRAEKPRVKASQEERAALKNAQDQVRIVRRHRGRPRLSFDEQMNLINI